MRIYARLLNSIICFIGTRTKFEENLVPENCKMACTNFLYVVIVLSTVGKCKSSFDGFKSFDKEKLKGPIPTDPDAFRNVSQLIVSKGYPVEEHQILTRDGYILSVQRIPHGRKKREEVQGRQKPVVLLQHGLLADSACWVIAFPRNSLGFVLADRGYDVWLSNSRGNRYCRKNKRLSPSSPKFWEWSFDNMAKYDIPSTIEHILKATGQAHLFYIGHSQGTLIGFSSFSLHRELAKKVKLFIALAPVATLGNIEVEPLRALADVTAAIKSVTPEIDSAFLPGKYWRKAIDIGFCNGLTEEKLCYQIFEYLIGEDNKNINYSRIPVFLHNFPSGTSLRNLVHYAQLVVSGKCQMFDYGFLGNLVHYGKGKPPEYPIEDIETPIAVISGRHDTLSNPKDVELLTPRIKNLAYNETIESWNHVDFVWGNDANELLYPTILRLMQKYL